MWELVIYLVLGDPAQADVSTPRYTHVIEFPNRAACLQYRSWLIDRMHPPTPANWWPGDPGVSIADLDQPPSVNPRWAYQSQGVGFCARAENQTAG